MGSLKTQWDSTVREWAHQEDDLPPGIQEFVGSSIIKTQWVRRGHGVIRWTLIPSPTRKCYDMEPITRKGGWGWEGGVGSRVT